MTIHQLKSPGSFPTYATYLDHCDEQEIGTDITEEQWTAKRHNYVVDQFTQPRHWMWYDAYVKYCERFHILPLPRAEYEQIKTKWREALPQFSPTGAQQDKGEIILNLDWKIEILRRVTIEECLIQFILAKRDGSTRFQLRPVNTGNSIIQFKADDQLYMIDHFGQIIETGDQPCFLKQLQLQSLSL